MRKLVLVASLVGAVAAAAYVGTGFVPTDPPAAVTDAAPVGALAPTPVVSAPIPVVSPAPSAAGQPSEKPSAMPTKKPTASPKPVAKSKPSAKPTKQPTTKKARVYRLSPVTALRSQATIDKGKLVLWMTSPTFLIAGHDTMGWSWLDDIPTGSIVIVTRGPAAGKYRVVAHKWQARKGGPVPAWMANYDLVLQTCTGAVGMGFSAAQRIS